MREFFKKVKTKKGKKMAEQKIIERIRALFAMAESSAVNEETANEALVAAKMARQLLEKYKLDHSDLMTPQEKIEWEIENEIGKTILLNDFIRANARSKRCNWFEELARSIASSYNCKVGIEYGGETAIYGSELEREVAILTFKHLARNADFICGIEMKLAEKNVGKLTFDFKTHTNRTHLKKWIGDDSFKNSFHAGFLKAIQEFFPPKKDVHLADPNRIYNDYRSYREDFDEPLPIDKYSEEIGYLSGKRVVEKSQNSSNALTSNGSTNGSLTNGTNGGLVSLRKEKKFVPQLGIGGAILAIDVSGSMSGSKLNQAKAGAIDFMQSVINQNFATGVIAFSDHAETVVEQTLELSPQVKKKIESLEIIGSTNMAAAIRETIRKFIYRKNKRVLVIATDGQPDSKEETLKEANLAKSLGIEIRCIGVDGADEAFLKQLASNPNWALKADSSNLQIGIGSMAKMLNA